MNQLPSVPPHPTAHLVAIAGLLHDAGKILQPANLDLPAHIQRLESSICPSDPKSMRPTHRHVLYTALALDQARTNFGGLDASSVFRIACYHHRPSSDSFLENVLTKADWLASGHDRRSASEPGDAVTGVIPALGMLEWPGRVGVTEPRQVPTSRLCFDSGRFLPSQEQSTGEYSAACEMLSELLINGLQRDFRGPRECVAGLLALLERVGHSVPASRSRTQSPDVNLFDHSRIVAAFAACLAMQHEDGPCDPHRIRGRYRLVSLALGQIQNFITRVALPVDGADSEKGMAKRLRARSFYVSLLTRLAAQRLLDATGMPQTNLLLDAGGRATLLVPDAEYCIVQLHEAVDFVHHWLRQSLGTSLRLDLVLSPSLDDDAFSNVNFSSTFRQQEELLGGTRWQFPDRQLLSPSGWSDEGWVANDIVSPVDSEQFLERLRLIGEILPRARYLSLDSPYGPHLGPDVDIFGYRVRWHAVRPDEPRSFALSLYEEDPATLPLMITAHHAPMATAADLDRLASTEQESQDTEERSSLGDLLTFVELAGLSTDAGGRPVGQAMLGILKADVDHLGMLLGYGLRERASFGRFASVARSLDLFFKGFLTERLRSEYPHIYTVFAGGDDLFLIGPWYDLVRLTRDLQAWFRQMTSNNPNVTFSAGLVFAGPTVPVRTLAAQADQALDQSKDLGRNRISLGSLTLTWDGFHQALALHQLMCDLGLPTNPDAVRLKSGLIYRFLRYAQMARHPKSTLDMKWRSQLSYDLKRNYPLPRNEQTADPRQVKLHESLMQTCSPTEAAVLQAAAMFTLYYLRGAD